MTGTIILDLDGPILDGRLRHYRCYADILVTHGHGFTLLSMERYWHMKRNRVNRHVQLTASGAGALYDDFLSEWLQRIEQKEYLALDVLQPGALDTLCHWKDQGISLILATMRQNSENLEWQLHQMNIMPLFDEVLAIGNGDSGKTKAEQVLFRVKDIKTRNALWIGDTEVDIEAARYLGIDICAVTCGLRTAEFLETLHPQYLETDLSSFAAKLRQSLDSRQRDSLKRLIEP